MDINLNLSLKEIHKVLCPECQKKVRNLVKEKITDQMLEQTLSQVLEGNPSKR